LILKNIKIYQNGLIRKGTLFISNGIIKSIAFDTNDKDLKKIAEKNDDGIEINCKNKLILPGIIDIHSHLRDMGQSEKETFLTGTQAAAFSGITTVFNMPNTKPPAITAEHVLKWMDKAKNNTFVNVCFIAGVPENMDEIELKKIIELGVIGFKIYPLKSLNGIDWTDPKNIQKLLKFSSKYQIPIFIHPDWSLSDEEKTQIYENLIQKKLNNLEIHDNLYPIEMEAKYVKFMLDSYVNTISENNLSLNNYPLIHFCHISSQYSYILIKDILELNINYKISFEITPHHLLLSKKVNLKNPNIGKVLPPLRDKEENQFLYNELKNGNIKLIGTDHAPHRIEEKSKDYLEAPSGFPGFETYPLLLLDKVCRYELSLENFIKAASENPSKIFNLKNKGFIKEGYDADLMIVDKIPEYPINPKLFKTKAKFSPFKNYKTSVQIWKVFLNGKEINSESSEPVGKIIKS